MSEPYLDDCLAPDETRCALCGEVSPIDDMVTIAIDAPQAWELICEGCMEETRLAEESQREEER